MSDVHGQQRARRALEIAAAGGHHLLMIGAPGCGKTMLASRLPSILPALDLGEALDITRIYSAANLLGPQRALATRRPFRSPHHSITAAGMVGNARLQPGEISLAHHGVLFLDEVPEFAPSVLELLRSPLEDRRVQLTRAGGTVTFPAGFSLIAAANPCPCGYHGHPSRPCICTPGQRDRYRGRLSGPLIDRIDLRLWLHPISPHTLIHGSTGEASKDIRQRVERARQIQQCRFDNTPLRTNAELDTRRSRSLLRPTASALGLIERILEARKLSARACARLLKVARTIADLDECEEITDPHVLEASTYRADLAGP